MSDTRTITHTVTVAAPPHRVYAALTRPDDLNAWWTTRAASDPRPGGRFSYRWDFDDAARNHVQEGKYLELVEGARVSYPWDAAGRRTLVTFELTDAGAGQVDVTLTHEGFSADPAFDDVYTRHAGGWNAFLSNLKSVLEGGPDGRAQMGLKAGAGT
jgi:uncharacterized protein YndB with AHSA1/START domain